MKRILLLLSFALALPNLLNADDFASTWSTQNDAVWLGPDTWANPMEDWKVENGRIECIRGGANRNVHLLTHQAEHPGKAFSTSVTLGRADEGKTPGSAGFRIGITSDLGDYRSALLFGRGTDAGITSAGELFVGRARTNIKSLPANITLKLTVDPRGEKGNILLEASDAETGKKLGTVSASQPAGPLRGNIALVNNFTGKGAPAAKALYWFSDWTVSGPAIQHHPTQTFGPIWWANHSLNQGVMKLTAQLPPVGTKDAKKVFLEIDSGKGFTQAAKATIDPLARTARFRIENWVHSKDTPYRVVYRWQDSDHYFTGTIRKEPTGRPIIVAGFTGNTDPGFPNTKVAENVGIHNPDLLVFTGDQIYESVGGYGIHRGPIEVATLNYLRKYALWGWAFRDLTRDRPSLCFTDDHDVYQGNVWGQGGRKINGMKEHAQGGYAMGGEFVNMVERTQTSHHPDPYDPTPIEQDIGVYYGAFTYGGVSFAVVEDRKFKSGPEGKVNTWKGRPDHCVDANYDVSLLDKPGLTLLGDRQLSFLDDWATDWKDAHIKVLLSQTIFSNLANYHGGNQQFIFADLDSNGWPQTPRNNAIKAMRRGFVFHMAGDQHLASIVHHGADTWNDAGWSFCVPSIAAGYPRSWRPDIEGRPVQNRPAPGLPNTGEYKDGLGNHLSVYAIANPEKKNRPGRLETLHDKTSGYGIIRLDPATQEITMECWKLLFDAANPKPEDQHTGWPRTIKVEDNYGRKATHHLPTLEISGSKTPVIEIRKLPENELVYARRLHETTFTPGVFAEGSYTVRIHEPESGKEKKLELKTGDKKAVKVEL